MANTLTPLVPFVVASFSRVLRETNSIFGAIDTTRVSAEMAARGQTVNLTDSAPQSSYDVTEGANAPALVDTDVSSVPLTLSQYKGSRFHVTGEDWKAMSDRGPEFRMKQVEQAIKVLMEGAAAYVHGLAADAGAYAVGVAGTKPFGSDDSVIQDLAFFLDQQQSPNSDRSLILEPRAFRNLFNLNDYKHANLQPAGTDFASGVIRNVDGLLVGWDQAVTSQSGKGTENGSYQTSAAVAEGATSIPVDTGAGTILAGAAISFAGGTYKYIVAEDYAGGAGNVVIQDGLLETVADNVAVTVEAGVRNLSLHREAIAFASRPPAEVPGGDMADDVEVIQDPETGMGLRLASYPGYHARQYEVSVLYGGAVARPDLLQHLIG